MKRKQSRNKIDENDDEFFEEKKFNKKQIINMLRQAIITTINSFCKRKKNKNKK